SRPILESQVRAARISRNQVRGESSGYRWHIQPSGFGIECGAVPIRAAHRAGQLERALRVIRPVTLDRWWSIQRTSHVLFGDGDRLSSKFRREVDQIVYRNPLAFEWRGFGRERLRRRSSFAGCRGARNGTFLNWPDRLTRYAIEYENESL